MRICYSITPKTLQLWVFLMNYIGLTSICILFLQIIKTKTCFYQIYMIPLSFDIKRFCKYRNCT